MPTLELTDEDFATLQRIVREWGEDGRTGGSPFPSETRVFRALGLDDDQTQKSFIDGLDSDGELNRIPGQTR